MKIRNGFVINSSASSFIIPLDKINDEQKQMIYNHIEIGQDIDRKLKAEGKEPIYEYYEDWNIKEDDFSVWCSTSMNNFDLETFVKKVVKVKKKDMIMLGDGEYWYELYEDIEYIKLKRAKKLNKIKDKLK